MSQKPIVQTLIKMGSFLPAIGVVYLLLLFAGAIPFFMSEGNGSARWFYSLAFVWSFVFIPFWAAANYIMMVYDLVHLFKTEPVSRRHIPLWALFLFLATPIALPIYWHLFLKPLPYYEEAGVRIAGLDDMDLPDGSQSPFGTR